MVANTYCHDGYCEVVDNNDRLPLEEKLLIGGAMAFIAIISAVLVVSGASQGIYVDLLSLS